MVLIHLKGSPEMFLVVSEEELAASVAKEL